MDGHGNAMKVLIVMIMLLVTLFLVLVHVEDRPLPTFDPPLQPSLHPFPLPNRLLSLSPHNDAAKSRRKKTPQGSSGSKSKNKKTSRKSKGSRVVLTDEQKKELRKCYKSCIKQRWGLKKEHVYGALIINKCKEDCWSKLGLK
jgi:hypothetical protein